ncbi:hypothetical protein Skr01_67110 [Sphaerisporangium krabiense]|uniref:Uncharacterized protein n=1 Tax=Sphaerisporangium krabiense TaxID=763782 RepID=A0A7W8Z532_9ACTN|nr:hypothetical protein [Sphaerisporangium krabiense]GII66626.1 hypothetical protein Skr01_67110 [Sphaerisporangium krabiense]
MMVGRRRHVKANIEAAPYEPGDGGRHGFAPPAEPLWAKRMAWTDRSDAQ